jgi:starvation-inducible outer membrane lipoprotein
MRAAVLLASSAVLALALAACAKAPDPSATASPAPEANTPKAAQAAALKPLEKKQYGAAITEAANTSIASLAKEPEKFANQTVRTEGVAVAVCKSMGCWMEIADDSGQAHIKMAGHSFFVPKDASGHRARVQGKVIPAAAAQDQCAMKDNCRENAEKETGKVAKVEIEATGVEFLD